MNGGDDDMFCDVHGMFMDFYMDFAFKNII